MIIKHPCIITSRLLPGIKVGDVTVSIEYAPEVKQEYAHRAAYRYYIDSKDFEYSNTDLSTGYANLQYALGTLLGFLSDSCDLFPPKVEKWANDHSDELSLLANELEETPNLIDEGRNK